MYLKFNRTSWFLSAAIVTLSFAALPSNSQKISTPRNGQRHSGTNRHAGSPLAMAHKTFEEAAKMMESALPIYDGHRHRAIELARMSAKEIREAATGAPPTLNPSTGRRHTASERASLVKKGRNEELSKYSSSQIAASNARMQQGMQLLQRGMQELQSLGRDSNNHMSDAAEFGNMSIQAATMGLQFIAGRSAR